MPPTAINRAAAETIALRAAGHLFSDDRAIAGFLATTGATPENLRASIYETGTLVGILDYLLADEARLLAFCDAEGLSPEAPGRARQVLAPEGDFD